MAEQLLESFNKQPGENFPFAVDFAGLLPTGTTISSVAVSAKNLTTNAVDNSVIDNAVGGVSGTSAVARVKAGTDGVTYKITFSVTLSDGSVLEEDVLMVVADR